MSLSLIFKIFESDTWVTSVIFTPFLIVKLVLRNSKGLSYKEECCMLLIFRVDLSRPVPHINLVKVVLAASFERYSKVYSIKPEQKYERRCQRASNSITYNVIPFYYERFNIWSINFISCQRLFRFFISTKCMVVFKSVRFN